MSQVGRRLKEVTELCKDSTETAAPPSSAIKSIGTNEHRHVVNILSFSSLKAHMIGNNFQLEEFPIFMMLKQTGIV